MVRQSARRIGAAAPAQGRAGPASSSTCRADDRDRAPKHPAPIRPPLVLQVRPATPEQADASQPMQVTIEVNQ